MAHVRNQHRRLQMANYQKPLILDVYDGKCDICQEPIVCEDGPYCHDCEYDLYNWDLDDELI